MLWFLFHLGVFHKRDTAKIECKWLLCTHFVDVLIVIAINSILQMKVSYLSRSFYLKIQIDTCNLPKTLCESNHISSISFLFYPYTPPLNFLVLQTISHHLIRARQAQPIISSSKRIRRNYQFKTRIWSFSF